jgi:hypothetical protein
LTSLFASDHIGTARLRSIFVAPRPTGSIGPRHPLRPLRLSRHGALLGLRLTFR